MTRALLLLLLLGLAGCGESMDRQNRLKTYGAADIEGWPSAGEALPLVPDTVPRDALARDRAISNPPPVTLALLQRGRQRYDIYCAPCHGLTGAGDGIVVARGFPQPAGFTTPQQLPLSARHLMDVIGHGSGRMYSFSDRVEPQDRWAIVAYIRALQLAGAPRGRL
jgi:mono/diheme cytochrome c family protein